MGKQVNVEMREYLLKHGHESSKEIARLFKVTTQAVYSMRKRIQRDLDMGNDPMGGEPKLPSMPDGLPLAVEKKDGENYLATDDGKIRLATSIGSKMEMILDSMTPEKAARCSFKDLAIAFGVMSDKQRQINETSSQGVGVLALALMKMISLQSSAMANKQEIERKAIECAKEIEVIAESDDTTTVAEDE